MGTYITGGTKRIVLPHSATTQFCTPTFITTRPTNTITNHFRPVLTRSQENEAQHVLGVFWNPTTIMHIMSGLYMLICEFIFVGVNCTHNQVLLSYVADVWSF